MPNAVGLDIGTHAVRAAELSLSRSGEATLVRFGQVALPQGSMRDGEVLDPGAVGAAIRRLWSEAGFRSKRVIVGAGNQRVIVRQADLPQMSEEDLRSALRFEAQELIPIPIDEAILDFQILHSLPGPVDEPRMRVLLVAAQREMVDTLITAVNEGGLTPDLVDIVPFALIRSSGATEPALLESPGSEAIVSIGAGITQVVVHEEGVPRFVRMLVTGGDLVTQAIAEDMGVDFEVAEGLKRRADLASGDALEARAARVVSDRLSPIIDEIRGSLDFYLAQEDAAPIARVLLTGGATRMLGLVERLREQLRLPVERAHPLARVAVGRTGIPEAELIDAEPVLAVPIGLALAGRKGETVRRLTLLPREVAVVREQQRRSLVAAGAVGALALLLLGGWLAKSSQVGDERDKADKAEAEVARLRQQTAGLQDGSTLQQQLDQRRQVVQAALQGDVDWTRLIQQIATVMPNDVWLTSFSGNRAEGGGTVTFSAMGFDHTSSARWLARVGDLPSLTNLWLSSSSKQGEGTASLVTFQSTANLGPAAGSDRASNVAEDNG